MHTKTYESRQYMLDTAFEAFSTTSVDLQPVASHFHDYYEIYLFESGDVSYIVGDRRYAMLPGDILLISPREPHQPIFNRRDTVYSRLVLWIDTGFLETTRKACNCDLAQPFNLFSEHGTHRLRLQPAQREALFSLVAAMAGEDGSYARARNNIRLLELLIALGDIYTGLTPAPPRDDPFARQLALTLDYIAAQLDNPLTLDSIAAQVFVSKSHLAHEFKRLMGMPVYQYINRRRAFRARQLLLSGTAPGRVAARCGFSDYSAFYRCFKAEYGLSPREFIRQAVPESASPPLPPRHE